MSLNKHTDQNHNPNNLRNIECPFNSSKNSFLYSQTQEANQEMIRSLSHNVLTML